jgi:hypothetical protein
MLLWRGFGFRWRFTSHRLPLLGSWLEDEPAPRHRFALRIGAFPADAAVATADAVRIDDPSVLLLARGRTELRVPAHLGWPAEASVPVAPTWTAPPQHTAVAVLDGFQLEAIGSPAGWHVGGLGLSVHLDDAGTLHPGARLRPAESPHPAHFGTGAWDWASDTLHSVTVGWAVLAIPSDRLRAFSSRAAASHTLDFASDAWERADDVRAEETVLVTSFDLAFDAPPWLRRRSGYLRNLNGRYLRSLRVGITRDGIDRPAVGVSNAPHPIIRAGALLLQALVLVLAVAVLVLDTELRFVGALVLIALALVTRAWPSIWIDAPAVPFEVRSELRCVALAAASRALTSEHLHTPDEDATSVGPTMAS